MARNSAGLVWISRAAKRSNEEEEEEDLFPAKERKGRGEGTEGGSNGESSDALARPS